MFTCILLIFLCHVTHANYGTWHFDFETEGFIDNQPAVGSQIHLTAQFATPQWQVPTIAEPQYPRKHFLLTTLPITFTVTKENHHIFKELPQYLEADDKFLNGTLLTLERSFDDKEKRLLQEKLIQQAFVLLTSALYDETLSIIADNNPTLDDKINRPGLEDIDTPAQEETSVLAQAPNHHKMAVTMWYDRFWRDSTTPVDHCYHMSYLGALQAQHFLDACRAHTCHAFRKKGPLAPAPSRTRDVWSDKIYLGLSFLSRKMSDSAIVLTKLPDTLHRKLSEPTITSPTAVKPPWRVL